jgi:hypothetical protein
VHLGSFYNAQPVPCAQAPQLGIFDDVKNQILIRHKRNSATERGFK